MKLVAIKETKFKTKNCLQPLCTLNVFFHHYITVICGQNLGIQMLLVENGRFTDAIHDLRSQK